MSALGSLPLTVLDAGLLKEPLVRTPAFRPAPEELAIEYVDWGCPNPNSRYGVSPFGYQEKDVSDGKYAQRVDLLPFEKEISVLS